MIFHLDTLYIDDYFLIYIYMQINENATYTFCKLKYALLPGLVNQVCVCVWVLHIKYLFEISLWFWQQTFLWRKNFYWLYQIKSFRKIISESVVTIARLNLKTVCIDSALRIVSFCFLFSSLCSVFLWYIVIKLPLACH